MSTGVTHKMLLGRTRSKLLDQMHALEIENGKQALRLQDLELELIKARARERFLVSRLRLLQGRGNGGVERSNAQSEAVA